ncbi:MAG: hypothetical protein NTV51_02295 [Verrucomicrobia bacterium]|nr:hypothetical protein [Verrucomicrobiota bacterium]
MLKEIRNLRQERGPGRRRWFESDGFELVVWENAAGASEGFQICYDLGTGEHALTWRPDVGFAHHAVDPGDETPLSNQTPILIRDGAVPWPEIERLFGERGVTLERRMREWVGTRLAARR